MEFAGTLGYVLHRASPTNHGWGAHKRENAYSRVMAAVTLTVVASVHGGSKVIGSSEQVHVVDALAMIGDEGRDSLR